MASSIALIEGATMPIWAFHGGAVKRRADLEEEIEVVVDVVGHALDHFNLATDALEHAGMQREMTSYVRQRFFKLHRKGTVACAAGGCCVRLSATGDQILVFDKSGAGRRIRC